MDTNPINGTFESFCFDGKQFFKKFTNPDKPNNTFEQLPLKVLTNF